MTSDSLRLYTAARHFIYVLEPNLSHTPALPFVTIPLIWDYDPQKPVVLGVQENYGMKQHQS